MAQPTVSKCIRKVTDALNHPDILNKYIGFPQNRAAREAIKLGFFEKFGIPGVIGCIDCTHVAIIKPVQNEERYFNRKYYHSLNVQAVCDKDFQILSVDAGFGGATHDSYIFNHHELKDHSEELAGADESTRILGDSGYPQRVFLMTPIENAREGSAEEHFNNVHMSTRNTIERTFGVLKARWRCLLAARELHYEPITAAKIVNACCVLHNLCIRANVPPPQLAPAEELEEARRQEAPHQPDRAARDGELQRGREARGRLVEALAHLRRQ